MREICTTCSSSKRLCYCFPQQVEVDKPCQDVDEEDFMMKPNELMTVLCVFPNRTQAPARSPHQTPQPKPEQTPNYTAPRTEEPSISFKIIKVEQSQVYIYTTVGFFAVFFIAALLSSYAVVRNMKQVQQNQLVQMKLQSYFQHTTFQ